MLPSSISLSLQRTIDAYLSFFTCTLALVLTGFQLNAVCFLLLDIVLSRCKASQTNCSLRIIYLPFKHSAFVLVSHTCTDSLYVFFFGSDRPNTQSGAQQSALRNQVISERRKNSFTPCSRSTRTLRAWSDPTVQLSQDSWTNFRTKEMDCLQRSYRTFMLPQRTNHSMLWHLLYCHHINAEGR